MTEENESMLDDSFDDKPVDEVFEGEEVIRGQTEDEVYLDEDTFEQGDSLVGEKYVAPIKDDKFVDVQKGVIIDKKDVSPLLQIKAFHENNGTKIGDPKKGCKKCYGRGYTGYNITSQNWIPCDCLFPVLTPNQRRDLEFMQMLNGKLKPSAEFMRKIRRNKKADRTNKIHTKTLELLKKQEEIDKNKSTSATQEANNG